MSDFPVDIFRIAYDGTREEDKVPMSVFQTGRHFREGWATCDDQCETLQEMFYNQVCERVLLDRFAKYPATKLELYCVPITIAKQIAVNDYRFTKVTYGEWKENWEKNGWQNTEVSQSTEPSCRLGREIEGLNHHNVRVLVIVREREVSVNM